MSANTKIIVLRMKELLYTAIFVILGILLLLTILFFSTSKEDSSVETSAADITYDKYIPGIYHTQLTLGGMNVDMEIALDADHINSISLVNLEESVETMYPLLEPTFDTLSKQICEKQTIENITYSTESKYTSLMILNAIDDTIKKACIQ